MARKLLILSWVAYIPSFCLPSYDTAYGIQCAFLQGTFWEEAVTGHWPSIHYELLTLANLFFIASPFLWSWSRRHRSRHSHSRAWTYCAGGAFVACSLVWGFLMILLHDAEARNDLKMGAYLWAFSFLLLLLSALFLYEDAPQIAASETSPVISE